jgi:hypothetical protein
VKRSACLLAVALLAAGCGGSGDGRLSKSAYEAKLRTVFVAASDRLRADPGVRGSPTLVANIAAGYRGIASILRGVRPPADVTRINDELVAGASRQATMLSVLAAKIKGKPKAVRERILARFDPSRIAGQEDFDRAVAALEAKGYRFRPNGGT